MSQMVWKGSRDLEVLLRPISSMSEDPDNARLHPDDNMETIHNSLSMFGQKKPIVVWRHHDPSVGLLVICGNGTYRAAVGLGWTHVSCTEFEGNELAARAYAIVDNRSSELSQWHAERLEFQTGVIAANWSAEAAGGIEWKPESVGFSAAAMEDMKPARAKPARNADDGLTPAARDRQKAEAAVEIETSVAVQVGDLYRLGEHLVICGDATHPEVLDRLMGSERAALIQSDPPYGMNKGGVANDDLHGAALDAFQLAWWHACRPFLSDNGSAYIWGNAPDLWRLWYAADLKLVKTIDDGPTHYQRGLGQSEKWITFRNEIVWDKETAPGMLSDEMRSFPVSTERALFFQLGEQELDIDAGNYWEGWEPLREALAAELEKTGWKNKKVQEILGSHMAKHYFTKSQWCMIAEEAYGKLQAAGAEHDSFQYPYSEIRAVYEELKRQYDKEIRDPFYAARSFFDCTHDNVAEVWSFPRVTGEERHGHETPKPVKLIERMIRSSCPEGGIVLEPFAGTGTTLIAAEMSGRKCRTIEIKPEYVATVLARWEKLTGRKAEKLA